MSLTKSLWVVAPGKIEFKEHLLGSPRENEIKIKTLYSGISAGTEMLVYRGGNSPGNRAGYLPVYNGGQLCFSSKVWL